MRSSYVYLAFTLEYAIEFPLFFAYHPTTLTFPSNVVTTVPLPTFSQSIVQLAVFFAIDWAFYFYVQRFLNMETRKADADPTETGDGDAFRLTMEFIRPRGALLLAVAFVGSPSPLNTYTGRLHVLSMVSWIILRHSGSLWESNELKSIVGL